MKTERTKQLPSYEFRNLSEGGDPLSADPDSETIRRKDGSSPVPPVMGIFPEESGGGNTMRIQTKMVIASLVVIALAFAAVSGAAYVRSLNAEETATVGDSSDTKYSDYKLQIAEVASAAAITLPEGITESGFTDGNTVYDGKSYYKTLSEAISAGSTVLYCKPGADIGTACKIQNSVTVYGNNAEIGGVFTVDASAAENSITVSLSDCIGIGGFTVNGVSEKNININISGCSFVKQDSIIAVDSDSSGKITIKDTEFSGYVIAVNAENCGSQDITVKGCRFADCGTVKLSEEYNEKSACAIRTAAVGNNSVSYVAVSDNIFRYSGDNQPAGAEIIVGGSESEGTVTWNSADGCIVGDTVCEDSVKITSITVASGAKAKAVLGETGKIVLESKDNEVCTLVSDVLYISTAGGLYSFANEVLKGRTFAGEKVILRNDLDLNGKNWIPVSNFKGTFDGNGKTVSNFKVTAGAYAGFFGKTEGTVKDFSIEYAEISGTQYVGGIAGYIDGTIEKCNVYRSAVSGSEDYVGGIVGCAAGTVDRCTVSITELAAYRDVGGIAGASDKSLTITNCEVKNVNITQDLSDNPDNIDVKGRSTEGKVYLTWNSICCSKNGWDGSGNSGFVIRGQ